MASPTFLNVVQLLSTPVSSPPSNSGGSSSWASVSFVNSFVFVWESTADRKRRFRSLWIQVTWSGFRRPSCTAWWRDCWKVLKPCACLVPSPTSCTDRCFMDRLMLRRVLLWARSRMLYKGSTIVAKSRIAIDIKWQQYMNRQCSSAVYRLVGCLWASLMLSEM